MNAFVPLEALPGPLQTFAEWNPVSSVTQAARDLFGNMPSEATIAQLESQGVAVPTASQAWPMQHPVPYTLLWIGIIIVVFAPLAMRQYRRTTSRS